MKTFDAVVHTPEALSCQLDVVQSHPDTLIAGSLGRAILCGRYLGDLYAEFEQRGQDPLIAGAGKPRDIDVLCAPAEVEQSGPFPVDTYAFNSAMLSVGRQEHGWYMESQEKGVRLLVDPDVFAPVEGKTIYGIPCRTVSARTQLALYAAKGALRRKDIPNVELLRRLTRYEPQLPDANYHAFDELGRYDPHPFTTRLTNMYRRYTTEETADILTGPIQSVKKVLLAADGLARQLRP